MILGYDPDGVEPGEKADVWIDVVTVLPMRWATGEDGPDWQFPFSEYGAPVYDDPGPYWYRLNFEPTAWMPLPEPPK